MRRRGNIAETHAPLMTRGMTRALGRAGLPHGVQPGSLGGLESNQNVFRGSGIAGPSLMSAIPGLDRQLGGKLSMEQ